MSKLSSKKTQEGINNRLQVVMRSGKYTVRMNDFDAIFFSLSLSLGSKDLRFCVAALLEVYSIRMIEVFLSLSLSLSLAFSFFAL